MQTYHEWDAEGKHYKAVIDEDYQPERACGGAPHKRGEGHSHECLNGGMEKYQLMERGGVLGPEREALASDVCEAFYQHECRMLELGEWVALGVIVSEPCGGIKGVEGMVGLPGGEVRTWVKHCECCSGRKETDSLWGIVLENSHEAIERFVKEGM